LKEDTQELPRDGRIGSRFRRLEDKPLLTGAGRFVDDIRMPGLLHVAFARSPACACRDAAA
jgi:carbon-monoxide dehydrogenase large subunit